MPRSRFYEFEYLALRDGRKCKSCGEDKKELVIDHVDGNRQNEDPQNKRLLCRSCNRKNLIELRSPIGEKERENMQAEIGAEQMSAEMKVAEEKEPLYVSWLYDNIDRKAGLTFWQALYEGSDRIGISPVTARRYLMKKLATTFKLGPGPRGHKLIQWRPEQ